MEERIPHVYTRGHAGMTNWITWMCPSRKKGFVWVLQHHSIPTSWGDGTPIVFPQLTPIEDWHAQGWEPAPKEEAGILTSGLGSWLSGWHRIEAWP